MSQCSATWFSSYLWQLMLSSSDSGWISRGHWSCPGRLPRLCDRAAVYFCFSYRSDQQGLWVLLGKFSVPQQIRWFLKKSDQKRQIKSSHNFCHVEDGPRTAEILTRVRCGERPELENLQNDTLTCSWFLHGEREMLPFPVQNWHHSRITGLQGFCTFAFSC